LGLGNCSASTSYHSHLFKIYSSNNQTNTLGISAYNDRLYIRQVNIYVVGQSKIRLGHSRINLSNYPFYFQYKGDLYDMCTTIEGDDEVESEIMNQMCDIGIQAIKLHVFM